MRGHSSVSQLRPVSEMRAFVTPGRRRSSTRVAQSPPAFLTPAALRWARETTSAPESKAGQVLTPPLATASNCARFLLTYSLPGA